MLTGGDPLTIERTLQLAIAPAFILTGAMAVLNLLSCLGWTMTRKPRPSSDTELYTR